MSIFNCLVKYIPLLQYLLYNRSPNPILLAPKPWSLKLLYTRNHSLFPQDVPDKPFSSKAFLIYFHQTRQDQTLDNELIVQYTNVMRRG